MIEGLTVNQVYSLTEEIAPEGYVKATSISFTVDNTGNVQKITMIDKIVSMSKVDVGGKEVEGATIQVKDKDGNIIDEWVSTTESHLIKGLEEGQTYILHEEVTADGYVKATDVEFTVSKEKTDDKVTMIDKIVDMSKIDVAGEEVPGAKIQVFDEDGNATMEQGGGNLTGTYEYVDEYTLLVSLDNSGSTLNYACAFAEDEDGVTMVLMNDDTGYNGIYFMQ